MRGHSRPAETERKRQRDKWEAKIMMERERGGKILGRPQNNADLINDPNGSTCLLTTQIEPFTRSLECA